MRPDNPTALILLIDGNNLAHFLYTNLAPGQKMTQADALLLLEHLVSYARQNASAVEIECCLDRPVQIDAQLPTNLRVLAVRYPKTADDLLLDRFWFHHHSQRPCLVITNDEAILDEVREAGGATMLVSTFVRRPGTNNPVLRAPDDLPPIVIPPVLHEEKILTTAGPAPIGRPPGRKVPLPATSPEAQPEHVPGAALPLAESSQPPSMQAGPLYTLDLPAWPVAEGIRFLLDSFCPVHRAEILELFRSLQPEDFTTADLQELAQLLRDTCGSEPDFVTRGGSLMDRVRLALLASPSQTLMLADLARRTNFKESGLRGRIRAKANRWLHIDENPGTAL